MTREILASAVLAPDQYSLLTLHRHVAERTLPDLIAASSRVNDPVRLAVFHLRHCFRCTDEAAGCERGARLIAACAGWRPRPEAAV
jgi:hypothetical protein